ncbi:MAG TPA: asparagine synthase (glutamine-hydrolyzing), partial [Bacteroidales bacterium]|nr:asparagine synthase (glutamine-hydrolyzing) [Bacteroidales bacterium]
MCGFVGLINKNHKAAEPVIMRAMAETIRHRGPDDEGQYLDGPLGLFHKRLSIIDLSTGHQPMEDDGLVIVFNGEIYNYVELRNDLIRLGYVFHTSSDTEVILKLYRHYGAEGIPLLNGMFAFILYDRSKQELLVARDHFGIKPLYFFENDNLLLFASEIKALLAHPDVKADVNYPMLNEYFVFQFVVGNDTLFKGIKKFMPGCYTQYNLKDFSRKTVQYWEPNFKIDLYHTEEYFACELGRLLEETVKWQLRSDVPLGTYLSGGLDSSLVTMLAARLSDHPIASFTGAFDEGPAFDESRYAAIVAEKAGAKHHIIYMKPQDFVDAMPTLIYHLDEPVAGPGLFPQYMVS